MKTIVPHILSYFKTTTFINKLLDSMILLFIVIGVGMALGSIPFHWSIVIAPLLIGSMAWANYRYKQSIHTVENTYDQTSRIHRILSGEQYSNDFAFIGHFRFSNGSTSLDTGFNFMKMSMTEYALPEGTVIFPQRWQELPIVINLPLIAALSSGKTYSGTINPSSAMYTELRRANIQSYTAIPITGDRGSLIGFIYVGSNTETPPDVKICKKIAERVSRVV